jgi:outer membrane beta-barrel protein
MRKNMPLYLKNVTYPLLLSAITASCSLFTYAKDDDKSVRVIEPNKQTTSVQAAAIDTEHFELGGYYGLMSVEDFNTNPASGLSLTYHIHGTKRFIAQVNYGSSATDKTQGEIDSDLNFFTDEQRDFNYSNLLVGYDLLDGRSFLGKRMKFNSAIYLMAGAADIEFANNEKTGYVLGVSYRVVLTDWLTFNLDFRDTIFKRQYLEITKFDGEGNPVSTKLSKQTHNTEILFGLNALF